MKIKKVSVLIGLLFIVLSCAGFAQLPPTVTVKVYQWNQDDGTVRYAYRVINAGPKKIVAFAIGSDFYHGLSELANFPAGWNFDEGLATDSSTSPTLWNAKLITREESANAELEWRIEDATADILPGATKAGFSIVVPQADNHYLNGHWTAFFSNSTFESAVLVPDDDPLPLSCTLNGGDFCLAGCPNKYWCAPPIDP